MCRWPSTTSVIDAGAARVAALNALQEWALIAGRGQALMAPSGQALMALGGLALTLACSGAARAQSSNPGRPSTAVQTAAPTAAQTAAPTAAPTVALAGSMGSDKALLVIDGQTRVLAVGASAQGVTLRRVADGSAEVDVAGQRQLLRLGATPTRLGPGSGAPASPAAGTEIVLPVGPGGHYSAAGTINGKTVQFLVDTGATTIAISQAEANRIGLDWKGGKPGLGSTANGPVPVLAITLGAVRLGGVEVANVAAVVLPADMPMVLLGNSFLSRFSLQQDNGVMRLQKKP